MSPDQNRETAAGYIRGNFNPDDRLALVLIHRPTASVIQRLSSATAIIESETLDWLAGQNDRGFDVYVSMNVLHPQAQGRRKIDIHRIQHLYLDFDHNGTAAVEALRQRKDIPQPHYLVNSSPGKWQVIWKVEGFTKDAAENWQRTFARNTGADPAATDCARVLRLPGFLNHKYAPPHNVTVDSLPNRVYGAKDFPEVLDIRDQCSVTSRPRVLKTSASVPSSQSERDWAFAKRALMRGDAPDLVVGAIAQYRRFDKHNPRYYAELTVRKAAETLVRQSEQWQSPERL